MPKATQVANATVSTTRDIVLSPELRRALLVEFRAYQKLQKQRKDIEAKMDAVKAKVSALRDSTGEQSLELDGFKTTLVAPTRRKFNPKTFVKLGGDIDIYNQANEETLAKPYELISVPGE